MKASDLLVKCLENEGIKYAFGVPGEEISDFLLSLQNSKKIKFILTRHEQGAAFMADMYGRLTGNAACCISTLGPGASNLLTGVANANMDHSPIVVITGQGSTDKLHKESHQILDICEMFKPVTKWTTSITNSNTIPEIVRKAVRLATFEKPGATHIELPENIAKLEIKKLPLKIKKICKVAMQCPLVRPVADKTVIKEVFNYINNSSNPIIIAGNGAIRKDASNELKKFSKKTNIPVVTTFMGKGVIDTKSDLNIGTIGLGQTDYGDHAVMISDLVITIGLDMIEYHPKLWNQNNELTIIHIDYEPAEIDEYYLPEVEVLGDIKKNIDKLNKYITNNKFKRNNCKLIKDIGKRNINDINKHNNDDSLGSIKPQKFLYDLNKSMNKDDLLISDVGAHKMWIGRNFQCLNPKKCIIPNGYSAMGFALPGAISAGIVDKKNRIYSISGDGGFLMNSQEMETAKRLSVNIISIIWEDESYGLIKWKQKIRLGTTTDLDFNNPDWKLLAKSFKWNYAFEDKSENLYTTLKNLRKLDGPTLFVVPIDYRENFKLSEKLDKLRV